MVHCNLRSQSLCISRCPSCKAACIIQQQREKKKIESSSEGSLPFASPAAAAELHKFRHYIAQGAINNLILHSFFPPNEDKEILLFFCQNVAQLWTDGTTTDVKMGRDKLRQLGSLNLSEHLHEIMDVCACECASVRARAVLLKCLAVSSLGSAGFLHALTLGSS